MPVFDILKHTLVSEEIDFDLDSAEETEESGGDAQALVDALREYAPGKETEIKSMLKYAANSNPAHDIFDDAFEYFNSGEKSEKPTEEEPAPEPSEKPAPKEEPVSDDELTM